MAACHSGHSRGCLQSQEGDGVRCLMQSGSGSPWKGRAQSAESGGNPPFRRATVKELNLTERKPTVTLTEPVLAHAVARHERWAL